MCRMRHDESGVLYSDGAGKKGNGLKSRGTNVDFVPAMVLCRMVCARTYAKACKDCACNGGTGYVWHISLPDDKFFPREPAAGVLP